MRFRVVALALVALAVALVGVGATTLSGGNERFQGGPRLDAERLIGQQYGETPGVATCPVSQQAVEETKLRAVRGTLAHAYLDNPASDQRAQLLAGIFIHEKPLENGMFGSHSEVNEALGPRSVVGTWNLKLHPFRGSESVVVSHALHWNWTIPEGHFVTLCIWVNNTHQVRYNWESQLNLITNKDMRITRHRPVCDCDVPRASTQREDGDKPASTADAGRGEAAANGVVPKNSVGSAQIKNRSVNFKDLSIRARVKLARDAQVEPPLPGTSGEDLTAFKSCVNKYLREVSRFLNGTRELAPSHRACP